MNLTWGDPPRRWSSHFSLSSPYTIPLLCLVSLFGLYTHYDFHRFVYTRTRTESTLVLTGETQTFRLEKNIVGNTFFDEFVWETIDDPTHGRVNYVNKEWARGMNLSYASETQFVMRADSRSVVHPTSRGRDSVRIISNFAYGDSLVVLDVQHMPEGCATWPAFWTLSKQGPWPNGGEIDIIEGVNLDTQNTASLHTRPGCTMPLERHQLGAVRSSDCNAFANNNAGCGTSFSSFGSRFNANGGGYFAMKRSAREGISVFFWPRNDLKVPPEVAGYATRNNGQKEGVIEENVMIEESVWGLPQARFPKNEGCVIERFFDEHRIVFDLTFCGDWAGSTFRSSFCGLGSCDSYVDNSPHEFEKAYWEINSLRIYLPTS